MTISNPLNRRRNINSNNGNNNVAGDTELLLLTTPKPISSPAPTRGFQPESGDTRRSATGGRIKRLQRPTTLANTSGLNQQSTSITTEMNTNVATVKENPRGNPNTAARMSKILPGKSLKYERLINQTTRTRTPTKAVDITSEAALTANGNEWLAQRQPEQKQQQQQWRLEDQPTAEPWYEHSSTAQSITPASTAAPATRLAAVSPASRETTAAAAMMKNWQTHLEGAEMHLSPAATVIATASAMATPHAKVGSRRGNASGNGGNSWSGNYQQQHPYPTPLATAAAAPAATTTTLQLCTQSRRDSSNNGNGGGDFANMTTGNGNSYGSSTSNNGNGRSGNNLKYFGNSDTSNGSSASDTDALLPDADAIAPAYQHSTTTTANTNTSRPNNGSSNSNANLARNSKGFYHTSTTTTSSAGASNNYEPAAITQPNSSPSYYTSPASPASARSASSPAALYTSNGASLLASSYSVSVSVSGSGSGAGYGSSSGAVALVCNCCSHLIARCCFGMPLLKAINVRRCVLALFAITVVTIFYYTHYVDTGVFVGLIQRDTRPSPLINCRMVSGKHTRESSRAPDHRSEARLRIDPKVLVFVETTYSGLGRDIAELLVYNRIKYKIEVAGKSLPVLTNLDKGRYGVIVFENLDKYLNMDKWNRELLDKYCREYSVGIVGFVSPSEETLVAAQLRGFPLFVHTNLRLRDASLNPASPVLRLTRAGETAWGALPGDDWAVFQHNHSTYEPIEWAQRNTQDYPSDSGGQVQLPLTAVLQDHGQFDGIQRVLFGSSLHFWLHRLLFLDALSFLSHGQLSLSLDRMILVDIDDIFVGEKGTRLRPDDVQALIATQRIITAMVPGFRFNLGFSGKYYHHGTREENLGDDYLLRNVQEFNWFSHMWKHQQPHLYENLTLLMTEMQLNYAFAKEHNIPTDSGYSISPHHSGVYPAHEILYVAWKKVWNVKVTSTEEYPHLRPARLRRGFIHRNIMVLPRQTCGLFTHTMYIDRYPGGRDKLDESIQGGELFQTIVYNPINIFMTHMSNYGSDRLALYTFQSVIKFLQCWTNLKLGSAPPIQLAEMYFRLHPEEVDPVWGNPCDDPRHKKIWSKTKSCDSLPKFLVIGPQKTGTTALYTFLSMHSSITSNIPSPDTFEEIQFFNGNNYYRGLDWYMDFFPAEANTTASPTTRYMFEKSATYFDGEAVPKRAHALLPHAKIVSILISPAKRAYSWYQHQRAHGEAIANNYSFYQVITAGDSAPKALKDLRNRCLNPGKYAQHLEHWLAYYPAQQLHIIDGEQLRLNPVDVMNDLQRFLKIQPTFDYSYHLRFDAKKGFFCQVVSEKRNKCLGKSKGRQYPTMDERSAKLLQRYYLSHNTALVKLLKKLGSRPIPQWLKDDLSTGT
ncbi:PREDICTED: bifunctional heparan sulfate N-deacetylase/N-sulfotransferase [Rhagoletis zephyria]|uniref:bifunctional heparan sulfate N-deacetylase/N-sulfotransferase n=1 Tax=Rhagoletis zephyria TaxID=28612 RepID=UPI00081177C7|nr:PREDICTED: bifunctional heparan sulfate N-deacetylase/N-sulfotransferase [Rhagoletis zephyria]XP_017469002.1 PREDICTED: bifunctional heparan sulfate N-deacetylase/N-sulfotransferase [Rhagoletis zephyria]XP_017469010.1 PREDICTED: bifunctional heparan sulfate N-deacetylase/N-sulfotransferase [Rhagoletis zephyria]XP_017469018.1 PREDICTED: bifunctional heparan sulfate N-deacetylase/N-sulfotransferase [Rhagoletis zephyria]XP_017469028.1 PREDICTED: bifunctional heparan sulfate N-deacetylase/N-sulf